MNKFIESISRASHSVINNVKDHSPEILVSVGIIGGITSTVMACKATLKVDEVLAESKEKIEKIHTVAKDETFAEYGVEEERKDLALMYAKTGLKLVKLYAPSLIVGAASIGCILYSNKILTKRNVAIAAAYTAVDNSFKDYRKRVVDRFGERIDQELKYDIKAEQIEVREIDEETGEEKVVEQKTVDVINTNPKGSLYAKYFDEASKYWVNSAEHNLGFVQRIEDYVNDKLRLEGRVFLNEVYTFLDIPNTEAGQVVGWVYDRENPNKRIKFGIYDGYKSTSRDFVNGYEKVILLDFNVDGNILGKAFKQDRKWSQK